MNKWVAWNGHLSYLKIKMQSMGKSHDQMGRSEWSLELFKHLKANERILFGVLIDCFLSSFLSFFSFLFFFGGGGVGGSGVGGANFRIRLEEPYYIHKFIQKSDFFKISDHSRFFFSFFLVSINFVLDLALFTLAKLKIILGGKQFSFKTGWTPFY